MLLAPLCTLGVMYVTPTAFTIMPLHRADLNFLTRNRDRLGTVAGCVLCGGPLFLAPH